MIPEYVSPPIDRVIQIALCAVLAGFLVVKFSRLRLKPLIWLGLLGTAVAATGISLLYSYHFTGGDYYWLRRGYPHYFWSIGDIAGFPELSSNNALQGMDAGPFGIYVLGNVFFYAGLFFCAYVVFLAIRNKTRPV